MQLLLLLAALSDLIGQIYKVLLTLCQEWSRVCSSHISQPTLGAASAPWNTSDPVLEVILGVTDGSLALAIFRTHLVFIPIHRRVCFSAQISHSLLLNIASYKLAILGKNFRGSEIS